MASVLEGDLWPSGGLPSTPEAICPNSFPGPL